MASNISTALEIVGRLTVNRLRDGMTENNSDASGDLGQSIGFNIKKTSKGIDLNIEMLEYWGAVDGGRRKGKQPPINKIKEWLTYPNPRAKLGLEGVSNVNIAEVNSLAFLIARKIGKNGTKGTNFATNVFNSSLIQKELPSIVADAVYEDASLIIDDLLSQFN